MAATDTSSLEVFSASHPSPAARQAVSDALAALIAAIQDHPAFAPSNMNPTIYHVWDFLQRSRYMLSEYESIRDGKKLTHPEQFGQGNLGTGAKEADRIWSDVLGRNQMARMLIDDDTGRAALVTGNRGGAVQWGAEIKAKVKALNDLKLDGRT